MAFFGSPGPRRHTVLAAGDDATNRAVLADVLRDAGCAVETAADGEEAIQRRDAPPARLCAVVLDLALPQANGVDVLQQLQERGTTPP